MILSHLFVFFFDFRRHTYNLLHFRGYLCYRNIPKICNPSDSACGKVLCEIDIVMSNDFSDAEAEMRIWRSPVVFVFLTILTIGSHAGVGVEVKSDSSTVLHVKRTGGSGPAIVTEGGGIQVGGGITSGAISSAAIQATVADETNAQAIRGFVSGYDQPNPGSSRAGILGTGDYGVMAKGTSYGVYAEGGGSYWASGVTGIVGEGAGVEGYSSEAYSYGIYGNASGYAGYAGYFDGDVYATGSISEYSDSSLKKNVQDLGDGLAKVRMLRPRTYESRPVSGVNLSKGVQFGLIAQEVHAVLPELVREAKLPPPRDSLGRRIQNAPRQTYMGVSYTRLIPVMLKAIQEQQVLIETLQEKIQQLESGR
jgi:hypothetical protein